MTRKSTSVLAATAALALLAGHAQAYDGWRLEGSVKIDGKGSGWDYLALDQTNNRLFIGHRKEGLQVFDLTTKTVIRTIEATQMASSNGATLMPEFDLAISNNEDGTITPFKMSTLEAAPAIKLGEELDTSHYDPVTKRVLVNMAAGKEGTDLVVLEAPSLKQIGIVKVKAKKPEHAESDGKGNLFMATRDTETVLRIDMKTMQVTAEWPTPGCGQTNSTAIDAVSGRLFLGCRGNDKVKPSFAVMNIETGAVVFTAEVGGGNDGVAYDAELKRVFLTGGVNAVMHVFEQVGPDSYKPVEALGTSAGMRSLVADPRTKTLYGVTAEGSADFAKKVTTSVSPWYANTFTPGSFTVLTFSRRP
jgi:hypothetical protein